MKFREQLLIDLSNDYNSKLDALDSSVKHLVNLTDNQPLTHDQFKKMTKKQIEEILFKDLDSSY